jgi:hypothetical protein
LFIFQQVSGLVSSQKIENLEKLLRSRPVFILVSRLKARDSRSRLGLVPLLIIKKSQSRTRPFVYFPRTLGLGLVTKYWPRPSLLPRAISNTQYLPFPLSELHGLPSTIRIYLYLPKDIFNIQGLPLTYRINQHLPKSISNTQHLPLPSSNLQSLPSTTSIFLEPSATLRIFHCHSVTFRVFHPLPVSS